MTKKTDKPEPETPAQNLGFDQEPMANETQPAEQQAPAEDEPEFVEAEVMDGDSHMAYTTIQLADKPTGVPAEFKLEVLKEEVTLSLAEVERILAVDEKIVINGHLDKPNYDKVKKRKSFYLKARTTLVGEIKNKIKGPAKQWLDALDENVSKICDKLQAAQDAMETKQKEIDEAVERENARILKEQQDRIQGRTSGLINFGASFNEAAGVYTFPYDAGLVINSIQLLEWPDTEYQEFIDQVVTSWNQEQLRIQGEEEKAEAERQRLLNLDSELTDREIALKEKLVKLRTKELRLAGAEERVGYWELNGHTVPNELLKTSTDEDWESLIEKLENDVTEPTVADYAVVVDPQPTVSDKTEDKVRSASFIIRPSQSFDIEDEDEGIAPPESYQEQITGVEIEEPLVDELIDEDMLGLFEANDVLIPFNDEKPFTDHRFKNSILRLFPECYESQANDGVIKGDIMDAGPLADTDLQFLLIKQPK